MATKLKVCIIHSRADAPVAGDLLRRLDKQGWVETWSVGDILPGQIRNLEIKKAIKEAQSVIVCVSKVTTTEEGTSQRELKLALDAALEKPSGSIFIIPLKLEECELPLEISELQPTEYFKENREESYNKLLASLQNRAKSLGIATTSRNTEKQGGDNVILGNGNTINVILQKNPILVAIGIVIVIAALMMFFMFPNWNEIKDKLPGGAGGGGSPSTENTQFPPIPPANPPRDPMTMLDIPGGTFNMGSAFIPDSSPVNEVTISAFQMDKTEVTNEMYTMCVQAGSCEPPKNTTYFNDSTYAHHPVVYVTWHDAKAYCEWLGKRLPSEAEWEKAARDTDERIYPWGNDAPNTHLLNYKNQGTSPVGNYPAGKSPYGILDMAGNVWEWTASLNENYPYKTGQSREDLNNLGKRVIRGGSWKDDEDAVYSAIRYGYSPNIYLDNLGFRCVK